MTATDDRPVNGHRVNGHGHMWAQFKPVTPTVVGPAEPLTQPLPAVSAAAERADATSAAVPQRPAPEPELPSKPARPEFPLRRLQGVGLAMTVAMAATGQIAFWRGWFGGGLGATVAAVAIAAAFEVLMIGGTDMALHHKAAGSSWWRLLFSIGASAAAVAVVVQLLHWQLSMGIPFAAASIIGWAAHAVSGWIRAQHYRQEIDEYDAEVARRKRKAESRADAEHERAMAERETAHQAATRAATGAEQAPPPSPRPEPARPERKPSKDKVKPGTAPTFSQADARRELGDEFARLGPAAINQRMETAGYRRKDPSTIRRWKSQ